MLKYTVKRVLLAVVTVFIISAITFFAMNAIPGGPFSKEKAPDPAVQAALEARFNLDKPVGQQYLIYLRKGEEGGEDEGLPAVEGLVKSAHEALAG